MSFPLMSHLDLDEAFYSLDLGLAEGSSVLGTDVRPHCQVGRLVCCLKHTHATQSQHALQGCLSLFLEGLSWPDN